MYTSSPPIGGVPPGKRIKPMNIFHNLDLEKINNSDPILCKCIQPWKKPNIQHTDLILDLMGCIISQWQRYKFDTCYELSEAVSDAYYNGIVKAIEKDKLAPTIANKKIKCPSCDCINIMPNKMPGDEEENYFYENCKFGTTPLSRDFNLQCKYCFHKWTHKVYKTIFSTHVYSYIRGAIQCGMRQAKSKKGTVSISNNSNNEEKTSIEESEILATKNNEQEYEITDSIKSMIYAEIDNLSPKQQKILALKHGIGGICNELVEMKVKCKHCMLQNIPFTFTTTIDYSLSKNIILCPKCQEQCEINMQLSQTEIANLLNVTKQRICNVLSNIHKKFKNKLGPELEKQGVMS
jgi:RNA polymerase sigma factor (sigma-70 family)